MELLELKRKREQLGQDLLEERLLHVCQMLESRISRIESILGRADAREGQRRETEPPPAASRSEGVKDSPRAPNAPAGPPRPGGSHKPNTVPHLEQYVPESASADLSGQIKNGIIPDIVQLLSSNNMSGILTLENRERKIDLFIHDGAMYHAQTNGMTGHAAFFAAIGLDNGKFYFTQSDDIKEEKTIDEDTQFLILEALRQLDEETRDE